MTLPIEYIAKVVGVALVTGILFGPIFFLAYLFTQIDNPFE